VCTTFFAQDIKDYQNGSKVQKVWNLKMLILGFLLFASRNITEINSGYKLQTDMYINLFILTFFVVNEFVLL